MGGGGRLRADRRPRGAWWWRTFGGGQTWLYESLTVAKSQDARAHSREMQVTLALTTVARRKTLALTVARRKIFTIIRHHRRQALTIMQDPRTNSPTAGDESLTKRRSEGTYLHVVGGRSSPLP